jgi:hypothetical protein
MIVLPLVLRWLMMEPPRMAKLAELNFDTHTPFLGGLRPFCGVGVTSRLKLNTIPLIQITLNAASFSKSRAS